MANRFSHPSTKQSSTRGLGGRLRSASLIVDTNPLLLYTGTFLAMGGGVSKLQAPEPVHLQVADVR